MVWKREHRQQNQTALEEFVLPIEILNFDDAAAYSYGKLRSHLEKAGTPIGCHGFDDCRTSAIIYPMHFGNE